MHDKRYREMYLAASWRPWTYGKRLLSVNNIDSHKIASDAILKMINSCR